MRRHCVVATLAAGLLLAGCSPAPDADIPTAGAPPGAPVEGTATAPALLSASFRCGDLLLAVDFDNTARNATLHWAGNRLVLPEAISASGARYADDGGNEFWNKGDLARLTLEGVEQAECAITDEVSPWDEARGRGIAFRGLGNEPGWTVEIGAGETPRLRAELDYGEREVVVERTARDPGGLAFTGSATDGTAVALTIADGSCSDGMSDQTYPASAELRIDGRSYRGCGAFLDR